MLICIVGEARSGKDTVAGMIARYLAGVRRLAFADTIKQFCKEVYEFSDAQCWGDLKDEPDLRYPRACACTSVEDCAECGGTGLTYLTPREAFQRCGGEFGRACWPDTWVRLAIRKAKAQLTKPTVRCVGQKYATDSCFAVVFLDGRHINEAAAVKQAGGFVWRVNRKKGGLRGSTADHASESEIYTSAMDALIDVEFNNDGTLSELEAQVERSLWTPLDVSVEPL